MNGYIIEKVVETKQCLQCNKKFKITNKED